MTKTVGFALVTLLLSQAPAGAQEDTIRLIQATGGGDGTPSLASQRRVVIGGDSRYALGKERVERLVDASTVTLPSKGPIRVEIEVPKSLVDADALYVEGEYGIERTGVAGTQRLVRTPLGSRVWRRGDDRQLVLEGVVADGDRGKEARVDVIARVVDESAKSIEIGPVRVPEESPRLEFSYGVEAPGWVEGAPPVRFRMSTIDAPNRVLWERRLDPAQDPRERHWHEASVSLALLEGKNATFVLRADTAVKGERPTGSLGVFANPVVRSHREKRSGRKNLIFISADTLRAVSLGSYGHRRGTSPNIDRFLGRSGVMVRDALAPMPFTPASHMSMFTGLQPCAHLVMGITDALDPEIVTLAELLRDDGYETAAFTENAFLVAGGGFDRGFDVYVENRGEESTVVGYARQTFEQATRWLRRNRAEPFFLFVHTYQVHAPYTPPRPFEAVFQDRGSDELGVKLDAYDREIRYLDEILGNFFDELERLGLMDDTILVLTSDHGEGFGEHKKSTGHNYALWDEVMRVPLFFRADGLLPAHTVAETQVGLVDLAPTLLDLLEVPAPSDVDGKSFAKALGGDAASLAKFANRPVFLRGIPLSRDPETGAPVSSTRAVRTMKWKLLAPKRLFDLRTKPFEFRPVGRRHPEVVERLRNALEGHSERCRIRWKERGDSNVVERAPKWVGDMSRAQRERLDETRRKLESLGYVE